MGALKSKPPGKQRSGTAPNNPSGCVDLPPTLYCNFKFHALAAASSPVKGEAGARLASLESVTANDDLLSFLNHANLHGRYTDWCREISHRTR